MGEPVVDVAPPLILVIEAEHPIAQLLAQTLELEGYGTLVAHTGEAGLALALREAPHLILLDLMLPGIDGFEVVTRLRANLRTAHIPVVILSARHDTADKVRAFASKADDYLTKPFVGVELMARIRTQLRHVQDNLRSPLTSLPAGQFVEQTIAQRLEAGESGARWAILYFDLDHFKAFNDAYGFLRGNDLIRLLARIASEILREAGNLGDFLGHVGGDDFILITTPDRAPAICEALIARWNAESFTCYAPEDVQRGAFLSVNSLREPQMYPLVSLSIGVISNTLRPVTTMEEVSQLAAEVKYRAKAMAGSAYYVDQRRRPIVTDPLAGQPGALPWPDDPDTHHDRDE